MTQRFIPSESWIAAAGLGVQIASAALGVWARRHLGAQWSGEITIKMEHRLIRSGPYRVIRHPIYTAMLGMFVGTALVSGQTPLCSASRCALSPTLAKSAWKKRI